MKPEKISERELLSLILDELRSQKQVDVPSDFTRHYTIYLPANTEIVDTIEEITPYGYIYLPRLPRSVSIYYGYSRFGPLLVSANANQIVSLKLPRVDAITLVAPAAASDAYITVWLSTRPFEAFVG